MNKKVWSREIKLVDKDSHTVMQGESCFLEKYLTATISMTQNRTMSTIILKPGVYSLTLGDSRMIEVLTDED